MKRFLKSSLSIFLALTIIFSSAIVGLNEIDFRGLFTTKASAMTIIGTTGDCTWKLDGTVLTISGNGEMGGFSFSSTLPWGTDITELIVENGVTGIGRYAFYNCKNLTSVKLGNDIKNIGYKAFSECSSLTSITIPDSVISMEYGVFYNCTMLTSIEIPDTVTIIKSNVFVNTGYYKDKSNWENGVLYVGNHLIGAETSISGDYIVKKGTKTIASSAFFGCKYLTSITISDEVTTIGVQSFYDCIRLETIKFGNGLTSIGQQAFDNCSSLKSITLPDSLTIIDKYAFYYCRRLETITIPRGVSYIGDYAFLDCNSLTTVYYQGSLNDWEDIPIGIGNDSLLNATLIHLCTCDDWIIDIEATCTEEGSMHGICIVCGATIEAVTIPATGHNSSDWLTDTEATVDNAGSKYKECTKCDEVLETAEIPQLVCSKPSLKSASNSGKDVKISWGSVRGADYYYVYRKVSGGSYSYIGKTSKTSFVDDGVKAGKTYTYKVRAKNEAGYSSYSSTKTVKHLDQPSLKTAENTTSGVKIAWGKVSGASGYKVYRKTSDGWKYLGKTSKTYFTDSTAKSGKKYTYSVKAYSGDYNSSYSSTGISKLYLADPTLKTPKSTEKGIVLKWSKVTGAQGYVIYYKTGSGSYKKLTTVKGSSKVKYTHTKAKKGKTYTYKVKAYKSKTYSAYSNTKKIKDKY